MSTQSGTGGGGSDGADGSRPRQGPSIREFLRYYVLVLLKEGVRSGERIRGIIEERSAENRKFRPSGQLVVGERDLRLVLGQLSRRGMIRRFAGGWRLTARGRERLAGQEERKQEQTNGKQRAARKLLKLMGSPGPGATVLDVGTGEGFLAFKVAERGHRVLGIDSGGFDYSKDCIRSALEKARSFGGEVEFRQTSVADLAGTHSRFDYVVTSQAMHCMGDQAECLRAIRRLLKPGGTFLCMDFLVGLQGFLHHGWHSFLAVAREEWEELVPQRGFTELSCHRARDYLVVRARKPLEGEKRSQ
jgi:ubiquinone/menaquinone biosynthesis C-methylase UbiE